MNNQITININVSPDGVDVDENKVNIKKSKTKLGKKSVLEFPTREPNNAPSAPILDLMGI